MMPTTATTTKTNHDPHEVSKMWLSIHTEHFLLLRYNQLDSSVLFRRIYSQQFSETKTKVKNKKKEERSEC